MRHESCDRARHWVSLALDDALSDLEARLLGAHLAHCDECRSFERRVSGITVELRHTQLVPLDRPIALPARHRRLGGLRLASASAAAAAAIVVAGVLALANSNEQVRSSFPAQFANVRNTEESDVRAQRRAQMVRRLAPQFSHVRIARHDRI